MDAQIFRLIRLAEQEMHVHAGEKIVLEAGSELTVNATGHATLWNGSECGDSCYFEHQDPRLKTTKIEFWELKDD